MTRTKRMSLSKKIKGGKATKVLEKTKIRKVFRVFDEDQGHIVCKKGALKNGSKCHLSGVS